MAALPNAAPVSAIDRPRAGWVVALVPSFVAALHTPTALRPADLPMPACVRPYFRAGAEGEAQYRLAVREGMARVRGLGARLGEIAEAYGVESEAFGCAVLDACRVARCPHCGSWFARSSTTIYCSDACKRAAAADPKVRPIRQPRRFLRPDCAHCHAPLTEPETMFCSPGCHRTAAKLALGVNGQRRSTCVRCGAALAQDQMRYCSHECHQCYQREWYAGLAVRA